MALALTLLSGPLAVCRLPAGAPLPPWALGGELSSITRTADELSIVCREAAVPPAVQAEGGWVALKVTGPLDFALTGVLAALSVPLAQAGIPLFVLSTYDTDYLLVKQTRLEEAAAALRAQGHTVDLGG